MNKTRPVHGRGVWIRWWTSAIVSLLLALAGGFALQGTPFEGNDGNLISGVGTDWDSFVGDPLFLVGIDFPSGNGDNSFKGKESDPAPDVALGSIPGNKSDLLRFYVFHEILDVDGEARDFLYLSWVRSNTLGSANMDFEFNQSRTLSANGITPIRTAGDVHADSSAPPPVGARSTAPASTSAARTRRRA